MPFRSLPRRRRPYVLVWLAYSRYEVICYPMVPYLSFALPFFPSYTSFSCIVTGSSICVIRSGERRNLILFSLLYKLYICVGIQRAFFFFFRSGDLQVGLCEYEM